MSISKIITFLSFLLVFSACSKPSDDTKILINIENEFTVSMIETLSPDANPLNFRVTTIDLLDCSNYEIVHSHSTSDESIIASIDYIREPENCIPASVSATSDINVGQLGNGSYLFQLNLEKGSILNEGTLTIDDKKYIIELDSDHGIDFPVKRLYKVPSDYIWGEINVAPNAPNIMDELLDEITQLTEASTLFPGNYGHFKIGTDLGFSFSTDKFLSFTPVETSPFIFKLTGTNTALKSVLENYRNTYNDKIDIQVVTSEGEIL